MKDPNQCYILSQNQPLIDECPKARTLDIWLLQVPQHDVPHDTIDFMYT